MEVVMVVGEVASLVPLLRVKQIPPLGQGGIPVPGPPELGNRGGWLGLMPLSGGGVVILGGVVVVG